MFRVTCTMQCARPRRFREDLDFQEQCEQVRRARRTSGSPSQRSPNDESLGTEAALQATPPAQQQIEDNYFVDGWALRRQNATFALRMLLVEARNHQLRQMGRNTGHPQHPRRYSLVETLQSFIDVASDIDVLLSMPLPDNPRMGHPNVPTFEELAAQDAVPDLDSLLLFENGRHSVLRSSAALRLYLHTKCEIAALWLWC